MAQSIGQKFTPVTLLKFALPSMVMMVLMSCYTITDGIFISRFLGDNALSAVNIVYPVINIVLAIGVMLATGGSAVVAKKMGEGKDDEAKDNFSMLVFTGVVASVVILILTILFLEPICRALGANDSLLANCKAYLFTVVLFAPACMLQSLFQTFFVTAGKPHIGMTLVISAGIANAVLDYVFLSPLGFGIEGAALATGIGQLIPAVVGLFYFFFVKGDLYFTKFHFHGSVLSAASFNGASEMVTNIANAVITYAFNKIMLRLAGENGVAAITILLYSQFLFNALFLGFSMGVAPVISYNYGAKNTGGLKSVCKICRRFVIVSSIIITICCNLLSEPIVLLFVGGKTATYDLAVSGFSVFCVTFLFSGYNIFSSALFTALSDGKTSAIISFTRTFVFILLSLLTLPAILGGDRCVACNPGGRVCDTVFIDFLSAPQTDGLSLRLSSRFLPKICQHIFSGHDPDKHLFIIHNRNKVLVHYLVKQILHGFIDLYRLIIPSTLDRRDRHILKQFQIREIAVL